MNDLTDTEIVRLEYFLRRCQRHELSEVTHDYTKEGIKWILESIKKIEEACKAELGQTDET